MGDILERIAHRGNIPQWAVADLIWFVHYRLSSDDFATFKDIQNTLKSYYFLRRYFMKTQPKKHKAKKKSEVNNHWANMDVRPKEVRKHVQEWISDPNSVLEGVILACEQGASISIKPDGDGGYTSYFFLPIEHDVYDQISIRSSGRDGALSLAVLMFKFMVLLPEYELPNEADDDYDFT